MGSRRRFQVVLILSLAAAFSGGACTNGDGDVWATSTTPWSLAPDATPTYPAASIWQAGAKLDALASYKFTMTVAGQPFEALTTSGMCFGPIFNSTPWPGGELVITGTVVQTPAQARDVTFAGCRLLDVNAKSYADPGGGRWIANQVNVFGPTPSGVPADSLWPTAPFIPTINYHNEMSGAEGAYKFAGPELRAGVQTDHYQADPRGLAHMMSWGLEDVTWQGDVWVTHAEGYPVAIDTRARKSDGSWAFIMAFDLTNVNDPANTVAVPPGF